MPLATTGLPGDLAAAHAMILLERAARLEAEAAVSSARLEIERLRLLLAKARRGRVGPSPERGAPPVGQPQLQPAGLAETGAGRVGRRGRRWAGRGERGAGGDGAGEPATPAPEPAARPRGARKPARRPLPAHLPRERIVYPAPCSCPKCGGPVRKLGEDVTESLECEPRRWKGVEHVREKVSCRACEAVSQPPAPSHPIARGRAGPGLLALVLAARYGQHLPLTRQSAIYAREGVEIDVSTLADWVGSSTTALVPMVLAIRAHVFAAERLHGDGTTVPVLAKGRTRTGYVWGYVRDDRPFAGPDPPAVAFFYSPDRKGEHPERHLAGFAGVPQADAYAGFDRLYDPKRGPGPILEAACGRTPAGSCSSWPRSRGRRSRPRRCGASTGCSRSSATSAASRPRSGWRSGRSGRSRWCSSSRRGCAPSTGGSRPSRRSARRSPTRSTSGRRSPASSGTGGSA